MSSAQPAFAVLWRNCVLTESQDLSAAVRVATLIELVRAKPQPLIRFPDGQCFATRDAETQLLQPVQEGHR